MKISDVLLGFKRNETVHCELAVGDIKRKYPHLKSLKLKDNVNYKVVVHCTEAERRITTEPIIREFVGESKIVYEIEKTTNVRSKKITEVKTNKDKFLEYLSVNNLECTDGLLEKLKDIEDNLDAKTDSTFRSFTLLKMSLRGAIGIKEGIGKDEIEIDFSKYADGLIAICGPNGSGKSTTLENCHPYPRLLTRSSKLQDHFKFKDSYRKLLYIDSEGTYYSIEMLIDARHNGKVKYLVNTGKDLDNLEPVTEVDGNSDTYEKWVNDTFGPIELFLRTCFFAKEATKGIPDIAETTKGQKKDLFTSLIGIDGLNIISAEAKSRYSVINQDLEKIEARFDDTDFDSIEAKYKEVIEKDSYLAGELKTQRTSLRALIKEYEAKKAELEASMPNTDTLEHMRDMHEEQLKQKSIITKYEANKEEYDSVKAVFNEIESLKDEVSALNGEKMAKDIKFTKAKSELEELKTSVKNMTSNIKAYKESHILELKKDICPTCGKPLSQHKSDELKEEIKANKSELRKLERELEKTSLKLEEKKPDVEAAKDLYEKSVELYKETNDRLNEKIKSVSGYSLDKIKKEEAEYTFVASSFDEAKFEKLKEDIKKLNNAINEKSSTLSVELEKINDILSKSESELTHIEFDLEHMTSEIGSYEAKLEMLNTDREVQERLHKEYDSKVVDAEQYDLITKAFSKNGIQALELEAMAPEIAGITNGILSSAYGDRFKISFETLRTGSSGQLIEDFSIMVEDTSTGTVRPLEWLSSGEAVWIKEALYNAFTIERQRMTGFTFKTRFLDESDGSLDSSARMKYLNMIESAHREGEVNHTVIITHSQELKDLIPQQIHFSKV